MPEHQLESRRESDWLEAWAEDWSAKGRTNFQRATNYVLVVVLFAAVLLFADEPGDGPDEHDHT